MTRQKKLPADDPNFLNDVLTAMEDDRDFREHIYEKTTHGDLSWVLTTPQLKIRAALREHDESLTLASRRIGKSFAGLATILEEVIENPGSVGRIFSSTQKNCQDIVNDNMVLLERLFPKGFITRVRSLYRWRLSNGSEIRLHPLERGVADNARGGKCEFALIEEASFISEEELLYALDSIIRPMFLRAKRLRIGFVTTAAMTDEHWIHRVLQPRCKKKGALFYATIHENPHLTKKRIKEMKAVMLVDSWHREMLCVPYIDRHRMVIPEFDLDRNVYSLKRPEFYKPLTVIDFGGVRDKHGIVYGHYNQKLGIKYVERGDLLPINTNTEEVYKKALDGEKELYGHVLNMRVVDAPGQVMVDLNTEGFNCYPPNKKQGSWESGIAALREAFLHGRLVISPDCHALITSVKAATYNKQRTDWERSDRHGHYDLLAALIYFNNQVSTSNAYPLYWGLDPEKQYMRNRKTPQRDLSLDSLMGEF